MRLTVVDDPAIAAAATQLRGEWNAQTGGDFQVDSVTGEQLAAAQGLTADAVICPARQLGTLAERKFVAALPKQQMHNSDWADVFELLKLRETTWGPEVVAVSFGSPVLNCYYRADLLEKLGREPPQTWAEYLELAKLFSDRKTRDDRQESVDRVADAPSAAGDAPWCGAIEPLAPGWAGLVLLARAASYAKHRDNYSTLFHIDTMEPLVAGPPFVRALEELAAAAKFGPSDPLGADPAAAREAFWRGECGMALTWPSAATKFPPGNSVRAGIAPLPGSSEAYNIRSQAWEKRSEDEDPQVPLLSIAGRIGLVSAGSQRPEAAFQLLFWLSGKQFGSQVCAPSPATTLFRRSHLESPQTWAEKPMPASTAVQYAAQTATTLGRQQWLSVPAIPGNQEYLAALDDAVRQTVAGQQSATEALQQAAERWREITQRLGLESQKNAYRRSLGLP